MVKWLRVGRCYYKGKGRGRDVGVGVNIISIVGMIFRWSRLVDSYNYEVLIIESYGSWRYRFRRFLCESDR